MSHTFESLLAEFASRAADHGGGLMLTRKQGEWLWSLWLRKMAREAPDYSAPGRRRYLRVFCPAVGCDVSVAEMWNRSWSLRFWD